MRGHLREIAYNLGPPPRELLARSILGKHWFDDEGLVFNR